MRREEEARRRKQQEEEDEKRRRESDERMRNMVLGDMLNTGIPGGLDMDITTPL
jgi:hypothetical protein